jgi:Citrate synthase, C-terminal domain
MRSGEGLRSFDLLMLRDVATTRQPRSRSACVKPRPMPLEGIVANETRTAGWTAHVLEQLADNRLYRPLSEYTGDPVGKKFLPIHQR